MKLRDYQQEAINDIERNKKNLVFLATGGGKSLIFKQFVLSCVEENKKVMFIVSGNSILEQAVRKHFTEIMDQCDISMMQGQNKWSKTKLLCCSIQTLSRRTHLYNELISEYDAFVIDEAHNCTSESYKSFLSLIKNKTVLGLSATPYMIGKKGHTYWDKIIKPTNIRTLIDQKHLVFPKCYVAETKMKTNVKITAGDYNQKELFKANDNSVVYGSITGEYLKHGQNRKAICFAINIEHSKTIALSFLSLGINAVHADADTPMDERLQILKDFEFGDIQILCNVNIFSTGIDMATPVVGVMARPTKSRVLWIQQVGRLLRPNPNKSFAIILDHGNNIFHNGHPLTDFEAELSDSDKKKNDENKLKIFQCPKCFYVYGEARSSCPMCSHVNESIERKIKEQKDAELKEIEFKEKNCPYKKIKALYFINLKIDATMIDERDKIFNDAKKYGWKPNSIFFKLYALYGEESRLVIKYPEWFNKIQNEKKLLLPTPGTSS